MAIFYVEHHDHLSEDRAFFRRVGARLRQPTRGFLAASTDDSHSLAEIWHETPE